MYFDEPEESLELDAPWDLRLVLSVNSVFILLLGLFPDRLIAVCAQAFA